MEVLSDEEYLQMLDKQLDKEFAGLLEVFYVTEKVRGYSIEGLDKGCIKKLKVRGGFDLRYSSKQKINRDIHIISKLLQMFNRGEAYII